MIEELDNNARQKVFEECYQSLGYGADGLGLGRMLIFDDRARAGIQLVVENTMHELSIPNTSNNIYQDAYCLTTHSVSFDIYLFLFLIYF